MIYDCKLDYFSDIPARKNSFVLDIELIGYTDHTNMYA